MHWYRLTLAFFLVFFLIKTAAAVTDIFSADNLLSENGKKSKVKTDDVVPFKVVGYLKNLDDNRWVILAFTNPPTRSQQYFGVGARLTADIVIKAIDKHWLTLSNGKRLPMP